MVTPTPPVRPLANTVFGWIPLATVTCYLIIAGLAQRQMDVLSELTW